MRFRAFVIIAACALVPAAAYAADSSAEDKAAAEALFEQGRQLVEQGKYADACPKFAASQKIAPAVGTLLNLGDCLDRAGKIASAWAIFREAVAAAQRAKRSDREETARARADKLKPKLPKLTVRARPGVSVTRDGTRVDESLFDTPLPVDPGAHVVEASAPGKTTFSQKVSIEAGATIVVDVPPLEDVGAASKTGPVEAAGNSGGTGSNNGSEPGSSTVSLYEKPSSGHPLPAQRVIAIGAFAVGVVGVGVGAFFGLRASSQWSDAKSHCSGTSCDGTGVDAASSAKSAGNLSTIAFIAGGAALAAGAILWFTAPHAAVQSANGPSARRPSAGLGFSPAGIVLRGEM